MPTIFPIPNDASGVNSEEHPFSWLTLKNNFLRLLGAVNDLDSKTGAASSSAAGLIKKATQAQAVAGAADDAALTPLAARANTIIAARVLGGQAYQDMLGLPPPAMEMDAWKAKDLAGGIPTGFTFTRASTATRIGPTGLVESVEAGVLRHEWNPETLECLGLLIEDSRTNLCLFSEQIDNPVWGRNRATILANAAMAPDGTLSADKLVEDTQTGAHQANQTFSFTAGLSYALSVFVKAGERKYLELFFGSGSFGATITAKFDLMAGVLVNSVGSPATFVQRLPGGWLRVGMAATATTTAASGVQMRMGDDSGNVSYAGDGASGLYLWGGQLEVDNAPTSYIPTTSVATTRAADVLTMDTAGWLRPKEGTLLCEVVLGHGVIGSYNRIWSLDDGTTSNRVNLFVNTLGNIGAAVNVAGAQTAAMANIKNAAACTRFLVALGYGSGEAAGCADGGGVSSASGALPDGLTTLRVGTWHSNDQQLNGHVRRLAYFPKRLSDAQLQDLTYVA